MTWMIHSKPDCKWCKRAKAHLAIRGIYFEEMCYLTPEQQLRFKERSGHDTFPQIFDGETHVGGFDKLKEYLA